MYTIKDMAVQIDIQMDKGIYVFDEISATGKTRLCKLFKDYQAYGKEVASYTYNDKLRGEDINKLLNNSKYKVVLLDRYDMYNGDASEDIIKKSKDAVVLIDCKSKLNIQSDYDWCDIIMEPYKIEVKP